VFGAIAFYAVGFALVWLPLFVLELHADFQLQYRRFIGFFTHASGWGAHAAGKFQLFPREIYEPRLGLLLLQGALAVAALYRLRRERAQLIVWLLILPVGWAVHSYAYYANKNGGGTHYYFAFFITAWFLVIHGLRGRGRWRPVAQVAVAGLFIWCFPWQAILAQGRHFREVDAQSRAFLAQVAARTGGQPIFGENAHLFKRAYAGEVVDCGDVADVMSGSGYFGEELRRTYQHYLSEVVAHPPKFVLSAWLDVPNFAATSSARFTQLLRERYRLVLRGPPTLIANRKGGLSLYERIDD